ncbi:DUF2637 domain-containing protein [Streptomyces tremellae]|uniref:Integral membrane protein n=1 Tax=Streptomyces tremellae TaxID=1124239 RepID=A0ABP7FWF3_9ACTN
MAAMQLSRTHRILVGVVVTGAVVIAGIGFAGSYAAVRALAESKGFGAFSLVFPIGIDAGICVLLALDLLLTWIRIPFPLLRQAAWVLTAATIAFNGAAAWPDPLGVGMHAVIPLLFIVTVEAARHAVGRIADITADKHMEGVRLTRWLLSPVPTFKLWRRMKLWELRSYEQVIKLEQDRLIYQSRLQARFGRGWRRKAPVEALMPLRLARYGVPLADTADAGLAAAGIDPAPSMGAALEGRGGGRELTAGGADLAKSGQGRGDQGPPMAEGPWQEPRVRAQLPHQRGPQEGPYSDGMPQQAAQRQAFDGDGIPQEQAEQYAYPSQDEGSPWFAGRRIPEGAYNGTYNPRYVEGLEPTAVAAPNGPGDGAPYGPPAPQGPQAARDVRDFQDPENFPNAQSFEDPRAFRNPQNLQDPQGFQDDPQEAQAQAAGQVPGPQQAPGRGRPLGGGPGVPVPEPQQPQEPEPPQDAAREAAEPADAPADERAAVAATTDIPRDEAYYAAFRKYISENNEMPNERQFARYLLDLYDFRGRDGGPLRESTLRGPLREAQRRFQEELDAEHIA